MTRILAFLLFAAPSVAAEPHLYRAARLWPGDGPAIADAALVVRDGKVVAVGKRAEVAVPAGAVVHELGDAVIIPGLIAAETTLADKGRDDLHTLTPHYRAVDGFDWYADYHNALSGGVTTVQIAPGARRLLPGQGAVVKLFGDEIPKRTLREVEGLRVVLGEGSRNPPRIYEPPVGAVSVDKPLEPTKPQLSGNLATLVAGLRAALQASRAEPGSPDPFLQALAAKRALRVTAPGAADVSAALALAKEFDLRLVLVEPAVAKDKLGEWKKHVDGVVVGAGIRPGKIADGGAAQVPAETARDLRAAGFKVALKPENDADLKELLYLGSLFTTRLSAVDALKTLTADAAAVLGVSDRVGTLAAGKDADFVVLTGDPFGLHARVRSVYVDGESAYESKPVGSRKIIRAARVMTGSGEVIAGGAVLIDGGTIRAVGRDVSVPPDAEETKFANAVIVPGFIDLGTGLGVGGPVSGGAGKLGDHLARGDAAMKSARQGGLTTVLLNTGSSVLAFKPTDKPRVVKEPVALSFALRGNLTSAGTNLRETLRSAKAYVDQWTKYEADLAAYPEKKKAHDALPKDAKKPEPPKEPTKPAVLEPMEPYRALFAGTMTALVEAKREDAIRLAVAICRDEFNLKTALVGADDAHRVADVLAAKSVSVVAGPDLVRTVEREEMNLPLALSLRGVPFAFQSGATSGARTLPLAVGFAVRHGLGSDEALRGLTASAAQVLGLDNLGLLAAGRDADLVVLSGPPFEPSTRVLAVMIDGQWVHREAE